MKHKGIAMVLAALPGLIGILGIGHLYAGKAIKGVLLLLAGLLIFGGIWLCIFGSEGPEYLPHPVSYYEKIEAEYEERKAEGRWIPAWMREDVALYRAYKYSDDFFLASLVLIGVYLCLLTYSILSAGKPCNPKDDA